MAKNLVLGPILAHLAQFWAAKFFYFKNLALSVTRYYVQLSSCTISTKKTNYPTLRKLSDGPTDGQMDQSDFIGCCPTNVSVQQELPKKDAFHQSIPTLKKFSLIDSGIFLLLCSLSLLDARL